MKKIFIVIPLLVVLIMGAVLVTPVLASVGGDPVSPRVCQSINGLVMATDGTIRASNLSKVTLRDGSILTLIYEYKGGKRIGVSGYTKTDISGIKTSYSGDITAVQSLSGLTYLDGTTVTFLYEYKGGKAIGARGGKVFKNGEVKYFSNLTELVKFVTCEG